MRSTDSITVVIPCFNAERYVAAALRSVLQQQWPQIEIVVVDDGSSDDSVRAVAASCPSARIVRQTNQGVAAARNRGIAEARGDWIAFLDADDIWLPGKLAAQQQLLAARPDCRLAYTAWHVWPSDSAEPSDDDIAAARDTAFRPGPSGWIYRDLLLDCMVWTTSVVAHRSLFDEVGSFDPTLRIGEDWDLWLRASRATPILQVPAVHALYRAHASSITQGPLDRNYQSLVIGRALARWGYTSPDGSAADKADVDRGIARSWRNFASAHLRAGNAAAARRAAVMALRAHRADLPAWKLLARALARTWTPQADVRG